MGKGGEAAAAVVTVIGVVLLAALVSAVSFVLVHISTPSHVDILR